MTIIARDTGDQLRESADTVNEAKRKLSLWATASHRIDCAEIVDGAGEVVSFYEKGKWTDANPDA